MAAPPDTPLRFGLVGTGPEVVEAIEALRAVPGVEIAVVADASDRSEGARLAQSLKLPLEKNWMAVFRTDANVVLELNGDDRQYERLLSIKPPGVEVMSVRGARLLIGLLKQPPPAGGEVVIKEVVKEVVKEVPVEVVREVVKEVVREVPVEVPVEVVREGPRGDEDEVRRLRRRVEELQAAQEQLAAMSGRIPVDEKMQALINMASGVGHVFNNVLAGVLGRTQLLLQQARRERDRDLVAGLGEIEDATRAGITALTRIQEFSRARAVEAPRPVDLNDVVQQAVEQTRPKWRDEPAAKGVRIEVITHFGSPAPVSGVEGELREAVVQLIANAVDAMPGGGTITVRTGGEPGRGLVAVSDTGVGMSESVRRRAFEPFFSAKGETGLGLGLSVVHGIMARHGGDASIESEPGKGTTVTLRVPTAGEGVPAEGAIPEEERAQVLVVDDDAGVRAALADILRGAGYAVTVAPSGLQGIATVRARQGPFDLVITDLAMPDASGWEVVEAVKKVEAATPVVIMSGFDQARATRRAKELGVDLVLTKPFDMQAFLNTVRGLLAGRKRL